MRCFSRPVCTAHEKKNSKLTDEPVTKIPTVYPVQLIICRVYCILQYTRFLSILHSYTTALCSCLEVSGHSQLHLNLLFIRLSRVNSMVLPVACYSSSCPFPLIHAVKKSNPWGESTTELSTDLLFIYLLVSSGRQGEILSPLRAFPRVRI